MDGKVVVFFYDKDGGVGGLGVNMKVYNIVDLVYIGEYEMEDFKDGVYVYNFSNCGIGKDYFFIVYVRENSTGRKLVNNFAIGYSNNFKLGFISNVEAGVWKIDKSRKEMVFYGVGGEELMRFRLYNVGGRLDIFNVGYRERV